MRQQPRGSGLGNAKTIAHFKFVDGRGSANCTTDTVSVLILTSRIMTSNRVKQRLAIGIQFATKSMHNTATNVSNDKLFYQPSMKKYSIILPKNVTFL